VAKLTEREVVILVKALGLDKAIAGFDKLDSSIKQTQKTSGELDRNMKGTANITSNTTKAFAKQAQGLGGLVHVYATVAANVFALSSAFNVLKSNADLKIMEQASRQLSIASGTNFNLVAKSLKDVTGGAISMKDAMQTATLGLRGGATSTQIQQITEVATKAAKALGRSVPEAVTRLTQAVIKGEPELADEFGIILRIEEATKKYAATLGKTAKDLTTFERMQAMVNQTVEQGQKKYGILELDVNPYDKMAATFTELTNKILQFVSIPIGKFLGAMSDNVNLMVLAILAFAKAVAQRAIPEIFKLGTAMIDSTKKSAASAIASYKAQAEAIDNLIKKQKALEVSRQLKSTNAKGVLGELDIKSKIPRLEKAIAKGLNPEQLAREFWRTLYSQISKESKKYGGDIAKVTADSIKSPLQKEFLKLAQTFDALQKARKGGSFDNKQIIGQLGGADITAQQYQQLTQIIKVYDDALKSGVTHSKAFNNAQLALNATGISTTQMMMALRGATNNVAMGYQTLRVAITASMQSMAEGHLKNLSHAQSVELIRVKLKDLGIEIDKSNSKMLSFGVGVGKVFGKIAGGIALLGSIVGGLFNFVMILTLAWEGLKALSEWLGFTNSKLSESAGKVKELTEAFDTTRGAISSYKSEMVQAQRATYDTDTQIALLGKKAAIFDTLAMHAREFVKELQNMVKAGKEGNLSLMWSKITNSASEGTQAVLDNLSNIKAAVKQMGADTTLDLSNSFKLITPTDIIKDMNPGAMIGEIITKAWNPAEWPLVEMGADAALKFSEGARSKMISEMEKHPWFKELSIEDKLAAIDQIEERLGKIGESIGKNGGLAALEVSLNNSLIITDEFLQKAQAVGRHYVDINTQQNAAAKNSEAAMNSYINAAKSGATEIAKTQQEVLKGTEQGYAKYTQSVINATNQIAKELEQVKDKKIDPFKDMMDKAPEIIKLLNISKDSFNTQEKALETLNRLRDQAMEAQVAQSKLAADITIAEQELETAKRNVGLVESKNFGEKKKALDTQYDAEDKVLGLKILQLEQEKLVLTAIRNQIDGVYLEAIAVADLEFQVSKLANAWDIWQSKRNSLKRENDIANNQLNASDAKLQGEIDALRAERDALKGQRLAAGAKVDSAAERAGESAADKAQKEAERIANLEASIAKKRLEQKSMLLALEKELGDAVEKRMEWELTGAREAVSLGNTRIEILKKELSMEMDLIPLKKSVIEAEAKALEVKAAGLEDEKAKQEALLEVYNKRQELNQLDIQYLTLKLEYEQKLYDIALKQHEARKSAMIPTFKEGSGIQGTEEFMQTAKVEFLLRWDKFMKEMTSPVDRLLDAFEGVVNSGVDAFVEAIANGENALEAAKEAIKTTMFELAKEWLKEDIKNLIYATVGSALGFEDPKDALKKELVGMEAANKTRHTETMTKMQDHSLKFDTMITWLQNIHAKVGNTAAAGMPGASGLAGGLGNLFGSGLNSLFGSFTDPAMAALQPQGGGMMGQGWFEDASGYLQYTQPFTESGFNTASYTSAFGATPSFGLGGLGTSFMNTYGTMPTMATQPLGSGDIFTGSNPLSMSMGSMLNMSGLGGIMAPFQSMTQSITGMGQSLMTGMPATGGMGMMQPMAGSMTQPMAGGMMGGGLMGGLGMSSMFMSMIPMLMGGLGGGSPAGQAAKEKASSGSSTSDSALGDSGDKVDELQDTTEEMKDKLEKLLTEIKDEVTEIKINQIDFQIEHMEKIDKNFQVWLATFQIAHMQDMMLLQSMAQSLMQIAVSNNLHTNYLSQIASCACMSKGGMAKGGIVSGLVRGYAKGAITTGPELAMIGEGTKREAIVPLPDNRSIPVTFTNTNDKNEESQDDRPINIVINGVEGTEKGLKRSAAQIAYEVHRASRNKVMRY
jgi:hypothetical protein